MRGDTEVKDLTEFEPGKTAWDHTGVACCDAPLKTLDSMSSTPTISVGDGVCWEENVANLHFRLRVMRPMCTTHERKKRDPTTSQPGIKWEGSSSGNHNQPSCENRRLGEHMDKHLSGVIRANRKFARFARIDSHDSRESEIRVIRANRPIRAINLYSIKLGVAIANDLRESIRANRFARIARATKLLTVWRAQWNSLL